LTLLKRNTKRKGGATLRQFGGGKKDELFRQIWTLEKKFNERPDIELAQALVTCICQVVNSGYYNPVLGVSWMPSDMQKKIATYQGYLESNPQMDLKVDL
jgi:hypothetical protein